MIIVAVVVLLAAIYAMIGTEPSRASTSAPADGTLVVPFGGHPAYQYFPLPTPSALVVEDGDSLRYHPLPPGCILGVPDKYFAPDSDGPDPRS